MTSSITREYSVPQFQDIKTTYGATNIRKIFLIYSFIKIHACTNIHICICIYIYYMYAYLSIYGFIDLAYRVIYSQHFSVFLIFKNYYFQIYYYITIQNAVIYYQYDSIRNRCNNCIYKKSYTVFSSIIKSRLNLIKILFPILISHSFSYEI